MSQSGTIWIQNTKKDNMVASRSGGTVFTPYQCCNVFKSSLAEDAMLLCAKVKSPGCGMLDDLTAQSDSKVVPTKLSKAVEEAGFPRCSRGGRPAVR